MTEPTHMTEPTQSAAIYKVFLPVGWERLERDGRTVGSALDQTDGYIHFSTAAQLRKTLDTHYATAERVVLAEVPTQAVAELDLRWEPSRGGDLFPHLYAELPRAAVTRDWTLRPDDHGRYEVPDLS